MVQKVKSFNVLTCCILIFISWNAVLSYRGHQFGRPRRADSMAETKAKGNKCPVSTPWPCRTPNFCLSFDFICDGQQDCPDGYDEDKNLCIAKDRPAIDLLEMFIMKYRNWLIPTYMGQGSPRQIALRLIESQTFEDYVRHMHLDGETAQKMRNLMKAVKEGRQVQLLMMGMPSRAWNDLHSLFGRIAESGFMDDDDDERKKK